MRVRRPGTTPRLIVALLVGLALGTDRQAGAETPPTLGPASPSATMAAEVNGQVISIANLEQRCVPSYATLELHLLAAKHQELWAIMNDLLLRQEAERRNVSTAKLVEQIKDLDNIQLSPQEIEEVRDENPDRFPEGDEAAQALQQRIARQRKAAEKLQEFVEHLAKSARVVIYLPERPKFLDPLRTGTLEPPPPPPAPGPIGPPGVVAEVNGTAVPLSALDARFPDLSKTVERLRHRIRVGTLRKMVDEMLVEQEAARRGLTRDALYEAETRASEVPVSSQEIDEAYRRMHDPGHDEAATKRLIAARLREVRVKPRWDKFVKKLKASATIVVHLQGPDGKPAALDAD